MHTFGNNFKSHLQVYKLNFIFLFYFFFVCTILKVYTRHKFSSLLPCIVNCIWINISTFVKIGRSVRQKFSGVFVGNLLVHLCCFCNVTNLIFLSIALVGRRVARPHLPGRNSLHTKGRGNGKEKRNEKSHEKMMKLI